MQTNGRCCIFIFLSNGYKWPWNSLFGRFLNGGRNSVSKFKCTDRSFYRWHTSFLATNPHNDRTISKHSFSKCSLHSKSFLQKAVVILLAKTSPLPWRNMLSVYFFFLVSVSQHSANSHLSSQSRSANSEHLSFCERKMCN